MRARAELSVSFSTVQITNYKTSLYIFTRFVHYLDRYSLHLENNRQSIIQLSISYTVVIPIFRLADLYPVIQGCDETTSLTSLSWCNIITAWLRLTQTLASFFAVYSV